MKKLTLLLVAGMLITGGAYAKEKSCCKKKGHCKKEKSCCEGDHCSKSCGKKCK